MWPGAYPGAVVHLARHTQSKSNVDGINRDKISPLTEKGLNQEMPAVTHRALQLDIDCVISSEADRAFIPLMNLVGMKKIPAIMNVPYFNEFRRPAWTIGEQRTPEIEAAVHRRIAEFGPGYVPEDGEETFEETVDTVWGGLDYIRDLARQQKHRRKPEWKRFLVFSHGLRIRQIRAMILAQGDLEMFAWIFRSMWDVAGYENGGFSTIWHGFKFRSDVRCWNMEDGDVSHIPQDDMTLY